MSLLKIIAISFIFSACAMAANSNTDENSPAMQAAKRVALHENTKELPSLGYQWSSFVVKKAKKLQASKLQNTNNPQATSTR